MPTFDAIKSFMLTYILKPFVTPNTDGSLGRIMLSVMFFFALVKYWSQTPAVNAPETFMTAFLFLLAYVFGTRALDIIQVLKSTATQARVEIAKQTKSQTRDGDSPTPTDGDNV